MKIPEIRAELHEIAVKIGGAVGQRLHELADETKRRPYVRKVGPRRGATTREAVVAYIRDNPDADYIQIASALGVNTGRVSEALAGFRQ